MCSTLTNICSYFDCSSLACILVIVAYVNLLFRDEIELFLLQSANFVVFLTESANFVRHYDL